ncbi:MAG TPA: ScyD/ScyE family protein, partial [Dehalococcoidia bacterium]|nr:ScyD/ScyE family protein [Dehalococcoidia bacterium]
MNRAGWLLAVFVVSLAGVLGLANSTAQAQPGPSAGRMIAGGLLNPRGIVLGPDGMLYVAEAGQGGDATIVVEGQTFNIGHTGRISKIDPSTGARTTVADGLPSNSHPEFGTTGPAAVAFLGGQLYYVQTHGGPAWGFPGEPTGLYKVNADGSVTLVADIGAFNVANPVGDVSSGRQFDIEPGGNPYSVTVRGGAFYVVDGNQNQVMKITPDGAITRLTEFPGHPVSTGITYDPEGGPFYVAMLGQFPFPPEQGKVVSVGATTGDVHEVASGYSALTDVGIGPGGQL